MSDYFPDIYQRCADLPLFKDAGRACLAKAERTTAFDSVAARAEIVAVLVKTGRAMSGEELVDHCQRRGLVPHDARAFGPVFASLSKQGRIEAVGFAARRKGHGTAGARMWRATRQ
jgi:hypothetical protein